MTSSQWELKVNTSQLPQARWMPVIKWLLGLVLHLLGPEHCANFLDQPQNSVKWIQLLQLQNYTGYSLNKPNALDRFNPPLTLPSQVTFPPALWILLSSCSSSGLWSMDISKALPFLHKTQRESPTLATVNWFSCKKATIAVVPLSYPT